MLERLTRWRHRPDTPPKEPRDHLLALLKGSSSGGEGAYDGFEGWWASLGKDEPGSPAARMVTAHEALHLSLNGCTAFGTALVATGLLAQERGRDRGLAHLIEMCRQVHESFATFGSVWLVSDGDLDLLTGRDDYLGYYRDAAELVPLPDGSPLKMLALKAAARVCMQSPALDALLIEGLGDDRPRVRPQDRPDKRFAQLHSAPAGFWSQCWDRCEEAARGLPGWETLSSTEIDPHLRVRMYADELDETREVVRQAAYFAMAELLNGLGSPSLGYDEHQSRTAAVIAIVEALAPAARGRLVASAMQNDSVEAFDVWNRERLVVRDHPRPATLHRIEDLPNGAAATIFSEHDGRIHVFAVVRPAFRLLSQFEFDRDAVATLRDRGAAPVVATLSSGLDSVDVVLLDRPGQLSAICDARPGELSVLVNIALSCLADDGWRDAWDATLQQTAVTGLIDLSPLQQFDAWRDDGEELRYLAASLRNSTTAPAELFACEVGDSGLPLLLPCTAVTAFMLGRYLKDHYPAAERTDAVLDGVRDVIEVTVSQLMSTEQYFDVAAYPDAAEGAPRE